MSNSSNSDSQAEILFECRKCEGQSFTAAEKDAHRQFHRQQALDEQSTSQRGSKRRAPRAPTPPGTDATVVTLFQPLLLTPPPAETRRGKPRMAKKKKTDKEKPKIRSNKKYDRGVVHVRPTSG